MEKFPTLLPHADAYVIVSEGEFWVVGMGAMVPTLLPPASAGVAISVAASPLPWAVGVVFSQAPNLVAFRILGVVVEVPFARPHCSWLPR